MDELRDTVQALRQDLIGVRQDINGDDEED
jgi:hypothetical protein